MLQAIWEQFQILLGLGRDTGDVSAIQMALPRLEIYVAPVIFISSRPIKVEDHASCTLNVNAAVNPYFNLVRQT